MPDSTGAMTVLAEPKTVVIERRWAIVGGAVIATLIIALGVALAIVAWHGRARRSRRAAGR